VRGSGLAGGGGATFDPKDDDRRGFNADAAGIRLNDKERFDVEGYCISEGWVKVPAGRTLDRKGRPLMIKLKGEVEAFYR